MIVSTIGRLIWVPIAFVIAATASAFLLVTLGLERVTQAIHGQGQEADSIQAMLELLGQAHLLISGLTILPALLLIILGEVGRIRSSLYYIIGGGLALASVPVLARIGQGGGAAEMLPATAVWQVFATAGFLGGWVYWLLAGRKA